MTRLSFSNAVKWSYVLNWSEKGWAALISLSLAAMLGPADFGTVSIALIYISFLQMLLDQGLTTALIQKQDLRQEHLDTVFWVNILTSIITVALSILFANWWAAVNHSPQVAKVISVLSITLVIEAASLVQMALLKKEMDFRSLAIRSNISLFIGGFIGFGMAFCGYGMWALVGQQMVRDTCALILLWRLSPWRPGLRYSWSDLLQLSRFSISNFTAQLALFADGQIGSILLGMLFGPVAVGLYRFSSNVVYSATSIVTSSIQAVSFPEFSRLQNHPAKLRESVLTCIRFSSALTLPALAGLGVVSGSFIAIMGSKWQPATKVLEILSVFAMVQTLACFTGPLLQALSKPGWLAILEWSRFAAGSVSLLIAGLAVKSGGTDRELVGIAIAKLGTAAVLTTPVFLYILMRLCRISLLELLSTIAPSAASSAGLVVVVGILKYSSWFADAKPLISFFAQVAVGASVGLSLLFSLDRRLREKVFRQLNRAFYGELAPSIPSDF